jgi:hypothetical protein
MLAPNAGLPRVSPFDELRSPITLPAFTRRRSKSRFACSPRSVCRLELGSRHVLYRLVAYGNPLLRHLFLGARPHLCDGLLVGILLNLVRRVLALLANIPIIGKL